jgi:6-phosphogluconolactonase
VGQPSRHLKPLGSTRPASSKTLRDFGKMLGAFGLGSIALQDGTAIAQEVAPKGRNTMLDTEMYIAYVGARTTKERNARGDGLNVYQVNARTGAWTHVQLMGDLINPSFLAFDKSKQYLYAVHGDLSDITALSIDSATGKLSVINRQSTQGKNPVHLAVDPTNRFFVVANHITSTLALLPRHADGSIGAVADLVKLEGKIGPHRVEQPFAKPHQVEFDPSGKFVVVPDKGLDCMFTYRVDVENGKLLPVGTAVRTRQGSGPRHIAFHPSGKLAYVINELDSTVTAYNFDGATGGLQPFQLVSSLPDSFTGNSRASEIAITADGRFLYSSNRGFDSIAIFAIDAASGQLSASGWQSSLGKTPRFFAIDPTGRFMFVANEDSDEIVTFAIDRSDGRLSPTGICTKVGSPVCIVFK